eukprot:TRINITY_DN6168_c0_g3_i2.p1 TRINITY_DN6168_c0_g3~~TRINITY_DN6168_c0_g3_i2.p1  ORF type:complete len:304 (-),score=47.97 TRINITY_DN6168_c0_g3_i2:670-1581(-)
MEQEVWTLQEARTPNRFGTTTVDRSFDELEALFPGDGDDLKPNAATRAALRPVSYRVSTIPIYALLVSLGTLSITVGLALWRMYGKFEEMVAVLTFPPMLSLPFVRPYVFQIGGLLSTVLWTWAYISVHECISTHLRLHAGQGERFRRMLPFLSTGFFLMKFAFLAFSLLPSEGFGETLSDNVYTESVLLNLYFAFALVFNTLSHYFLALLSRSHLLNPFDAFWRKTKSAVLAIALISTLIYFATSLIGGFSEAIGDVQMKHLAFQAITTTTYLAYILNQIYLGLFALDLKNMKLTVEINEIY